MNIEDYKIDGDLQFMRVQSHQVQSSTLVLNSISGFGTTKNQTEAEAAIGILVWLRMNCSTTLYDKVAELMATATTSQELINYIYKFNHEKDTLGDE